MVPKVRKSAKAGVAEAQCNLGTMYFNAEGVAQDIAEAAKWLQLSGAQGFEGALKNLDVMQQVDAIPTPLPGTAVKTILLTSAKAAKYNNTTGKVVEPASVDMARPGVAFVMLNGEAKSRMFKLMNLQIHP